ncbi:MAG: sodium/proton-translocating pyrophosphatase, partial [Bdellovibrionales bacterium]|nr:sodium/proton-translocating pyrophosphatase [Bdellovibrionales bacterium]
MSVSFLMGVFGLIGLAYAYFTYQKIEKQPAGNEKMREIAGAIRSGATAFLKRETAYLAVFVGVVFLALWPSLGFETAISYAMGSICSLCAGFAGMKAATAANVRTTQAASENNTSLALMTAFNGGA